MIIRAVDGASLAAVGPAIAQAGGVAGRELRIINSRAAVVPNTALVGLAHNPNIAKIALDRPSRATMERTAATIGAVAVRQQLGYDGAGIGVAIIDSGVASWHDDLGGAGGQRVSEFVDFVNGLETTYDDYGHGTHVAGIVAGNGSIRRARGRASRPAAQLIVLKVLDAAGNGRISDVIAALDYVVAHKDALNIRVVNLSVAAGVYESYNTDPLTLAAKRVVEAGVVVVAAAGNGGRNADGRRQYGGVTAPGNAPWVLTVGASSHMGTRERVDDTDRRVQLARPDGDQPHRQARSRRARRGDRVAQRSGQRVLHDASRRTCCPDGADLVHAVSESQRHEHVGAGRQRHGRVDVAGEPLADAERGQGDPPVHGAGVPGYDRADTGRGFPQCRRRRRTGAILCGSSGHAAIHPPGWSGQLIWGNQSDARRPARRRTRTLGRGSDLGRRVDARSSTSNGASALRLRRETWADQL